MKIARFIVLLSFILIVPHALYSQELMSGPLGKELTVMVQEQADGVLVVIQSSGRKIETAQVFGVPDPSRLVIDFPVIPKAARKTMKFPQGKFARALRIGTHPEKTRLVLDLTGTDIPDFDSKVEGNFVQVKVKTPVAAATGAAPPPAVTTLPTTPPAFTPTPSIAPSPSASPPPSLSPSPPSLLPSATPLNPLSLLSAKRLATPSPTATQEPTAVPVITQELAPVPPTATVPVSPTRPPSEGPELKGLSFEQQLPENSQVIRISLSEKRQFKLVKNNPKVYRLIIPNCAVSDDYLTLPLFPPHYFTGFTFLQAGRRKDDVEVTIGIEHGARVSAHGQGNDILVQSTARQ